MRIVPSLVVPLLALSLSAQQTVTLAVNANGTSSGNFCDPLTCTPSPISTPVGSLLQIVILGGFQPTFLLIGLPPNLCTPIPGFLNPLMIAPPGDALLLTPLVGHFYGNPCASWLGLQSFPLPPTVPSGVQFLLQTLSFEPWQPAWAFSNAVSVTIL